MVQGNTVISVDTVFGWTAAPSYTLSTRMARHRLRADQRPR